MLAAAACAVALSAGCASKRAAVAAALKEREEAAAVTRAAETRTRLDLLESPVAPGLDVGMDAALVISQATPGELGRALTPFVGRALPVDAQTAALWRENGLRLVAVPRGEWAEVSKGLRISAAAQRQWIGQSPAWTEIVRGPERGGSAAARTIALDSERLELPPGRLRLLARAWLTPRPLGGGRGAGVEGDALAKPELVAELTPQAQDPPSLRADRISLTEARTTIDPIDDGLAFWRLLARLRFTADSDDLVIVIAERPGVEWSEAVDGEGGASEVETGAGTPEVGHVKRAGVAGVDQSETWGGSQSRADPRHPAEATGFPAPAGPAAVRLPTLGEAMFGLDLTPAKAKVAEEGAASVRQQGKHARAVLLLIPRVPEVYRLLP